MVSLLRRAAGRVGATCVECVRCCLCVCSGYLFNATDKEDRKAWIIALRSASGTSHKQHKDNQPQRISNFHYNLFR